MSSDWQEYQLGELFKVKHGFAFKGDFFTETPQKYVLVTPGNFAIGGGFQLAKLKYYNGPIPDEYVLKPGQVVVTMTDLSKQADTLGYAGIIPSDDFIWLHNQRVGLLEFNGRVQVDPVFISYLLRSHDYRAWIVGSATGTTVKHTSPGRIEAFKCRIPSIKSQKEIGESFKAIDDKIELNRQINQTLEQIAQSMFKSWFVDFEPTRAKIAAKEAGGDQAAIEQAAMCAISGKTPDQLKQSPPETLAQLKATAALFPDALVDSELGEIPEGWEVGTLGDEVDFATGFTFKSEEFTSEGIRLARGDNVKEGSFQWGEKTRFWAEVTPDLEKYLLRSGDILIGMDGSKVGKNWVRVCNSDLPCLLVQRVARLRPNGSLGSSMLEIIIGGYGFKTYVENVKTGTSIPHISGKQIKDLPIVRPNDKGKLFSEFECRLEALACKRELNIGENLVLTKVRDILLPKLLLGEIMRS